MRVQIGFADGSSGTHFMAHNNMVNKELSNIIQISGSTLVDSEHENMLTVVCCGAVHEIRSVLALAKHALRWELPNNSVHWEFVGVHRVLTFLDNQAEIA